jgi:hypothetical protein
MQEIFEFRISYEFATRLFAPGEGKDLGDSVKVVHITKEDPRFFQIPVIDEELTKKFNKGFYFGWNIYHTYTKNEIEQASLFNVRLKAVFEPPGEMCDTEYDETVACEICGSNRKQIDSLKLKKGSIPKKDIARTIAGEVVVSEKLKECFQNYNLKGITFEPVMSGKNVLNVYQPKITSPELLLTEKTKAGINPFDFSESEGGEIYKCPKGHTIGLNLLSEVYIEDIAAIGQFDFFATKQKVGVKRGLLRPQPLYLCSQAFRRMIVNEKLSGFDFEVAHIE